MQTPQAPFAARIAEWGTVLGLYPELSIERHGRLVAIMLYEPFAAYAGGVDRLPFDEARTVHMNAIEFLQADRTIGVLTRLIQSMIRTSAPYSASGTRT